jgi:hypothetical protein
MKVKVVNMIPQAMSGEENQDSEPNLTVNSFNPKHIAGSAFTPNPDGGNAPIFVSTNGGESWSLNPIIPSKPSTRDITLRFGKNNLYAGIIKQPPTAQTVYQILRTKDFTGPSAMEVLLTRKGVDQPWVQVITVSDNASQNKDILYVGNNDLSHRPLTATIDISFNSGANVPTFKIVRIDFRKNITKPQDAPCIRPIIHPDGKVYSAFYEWTSFNQVNNVATSNVVIVRDDNFGQGSKPFSALKDPNDGLKGICIKKNIRIRWDFEMGQQRLGGDLSLHFILGLCYPSTE